MAAERDLRGAVALVTGGTKGIGAELVAQLSARGARLISLSRALPNSGEAVEGVDYRQCDIGDVRGPSRSLLTRAHTPQMPFVRSSGRDLNRICGVPLHVCR